MLAAGKISLGRVALAAVVILVWLAAANSYLGGGRYTRDWAQQRGWNFNNSTHRSHPAGAVAYNLKKPQSTTCEHVVERLRLQLIDNYSVVLKGIRYANIWGYQETENKGDAAIWTGQQILLKMLGIETSESCRFFDKACNMERFNASLAFHNPYSSILISGGGTFNDYVWVDQPSRLEMIKAYPEVPIRSFPQSISMTHEKEINETVTALSQHQNLVLAGRDETSYEWLQENAQREGDLIDLLAPDMTFMFGSRPDYRLDTPKTHDLLILSRDDWELAPGVNTRNIAYGDGVIDLGGLVGNITYNKIDWNYIHTPGIDTELPSYLKGKQQTAPHLMPTDPKKSKRTPGDEKLEVKEEKSKSEPKPTSTSQPQKSKPSGNAKTQSYHSLPTAAPGGNTEHAFISIAESSPHARAAAKAHLGFSILGSARFIITDRLHGHVMATLMGTPHVLLDTKLEKNSKFVDAWTSECDCVRVADGLNAALGLARRWFEKEAREEMRKVKEEEKKKKGKEGWW
ncbi:hypothetical protein K402DRAFT_459126 [Aulographum hederae CBS 113979]|uniref:Polysaccharide pyruvyl transferase domain-containing protein n=1 Tax=Aulographum hederae CBS 113979 TaxID=1176131 RepID=A0A6G1HF84_9PEZI|nr:hypothetical protein K402DRAFT_459126 [Aulographum hederae CBS 113979]